MSVESAAALLPDWLPHQRWFAGKNRPVDDLRVMAATQLRTGDPMVWHLLVEVFQGRDTDLYQVPLSIRPHPQDRMEHVLVGRNEDGYVYDALHDKAAMADVL